MAEVPAGRPTPPAAATSFRLAGRDDASCIAALAVQVFLDTYAPDGLRADLAREAFDVCGEPAFAARLRDPATRIVLAECAGHLIGFAEVTHGRDCPAPGGGRVELVRLYVQHRAQGRGIGSRLLDRADALAREAGERGAWLTAWEGNHAALAFYASRGLRAMGTTDYVICGQRYRNHVLARPLV